MQVSTRQLNLYLAAGLALALLCGCQTSAKNKDVGALRVHIETNPDASGTSQDVSVLRSEPVQVSIARNPILSESQVGAARVVTTPGGFAIQVQFDENGTWILEQYSAANPGKHFVIFGQWGPKPTDGRWLAAPQITRRISNGILSFTPDCSREEADRMVAGVNNVAKTARKGQLK